MADPLRNSPFERDIEQAITALKKGTQLLKYGRRGKPKFCPFRLSNDEAVLIWYSGKETKLLKLNQVSKIIPGQRTAIFRRYPRPEKEYQSFSLIYGDRSLDLICKDKDEAEVWFVGLKALISHGNCRKWQIESKGDRNSTDSPSIHNKKDSPLALPFYGSDDLHKDSGDAKLVHAQHENNPVSGFGKAFSDVIVFTSASKSSLADSVCNSVNSFAPGGVDNSNGRASAFDNVRVSLSSAVSCSSHGSGHEDFDALGDVLIWGEGVGDGVLGGGSLRAGGQSASNSDAFLPKALESAVLLDVHSIGCGSKHAVVATKQGEVFSWGEEIGGRLGHGVDADVSQPKLIGSLSGMNIELVTCGEFHTCAVTLSGDLYTWGDGAHNSGVLGHGNKTSHWIPKKVCGHIEGLHVSSVSCGAWHTAVVTSAGQLFTFGDGTFGVLGHGDHRSTTIPREVESLKGMRAVQAACGAWHTAAIVETTDKSIDSGGSAGKLFTWGDGDKGRLGHGDREPRLLPACVASLPEACFYQVACGHDITVALSASGRVYTMGSTLFGQLGNPEADGKGPTCVEGRISNSFVEEIACGSHHVAVLTSKTEVFTWGKGANGRLGHGDNDDRDTPTLVEALKDKQVKTIVCGSSFTAVICLHKFISTSDQSMCSGCRLPFGLRRKRHNCYNCGLVFCRACSSRKSARASLAPNMNKPYRVCDECYTKLKRAASNALVSRNSKLQNGSLHQTPDEIAGKDALDGRMQGQLSRLFSADSFEGESRPSWHNNSCLPAVPGPWGDLHPPSSSKFLYGASKKIFSASVPASRIVSRSTSPVPCRPSLPHLSNTPHVGFPLSSEVFLDDSNQEPEDLAQEVARLHLQVEELTRKSELLEAELHATSKQLREATTIAVEQTAKCEAAKELVKSLTSQLKDRADSVPEGYVSSSTYGSLASNSLANPFSDQHVDNLLVSGIPDSNGDAGHQFPCNGNKASAEVEWVEQVEPGVYITVSSTTTGDKYLKRVRFSRKRFTEQQAESWWAENRSKLYDKFGILTGKTATACCSSMSDTKDSL